MDRCNGWYVNIYNFNSQGLQTARVNASNIYKVFGSVAEAAGIIKWSWHKSELGNLHAAGSLPRLLPTHYSDWAIMKALWQETEISESFRYFVSHTPPTPIQSETHHVPVCKQKRSHSWKEPEALNKEPGSPPSPFQCCPSPNGS